jgi:hypothetical protein
MHKYGLKNQMCVLGCMLRSNARNGNECQTPRHRRLAANIEIHGFKILVNPKLVWNSWNLACYHGTTSTCCGKKNIPFGVGLGISFSQTRASHNKPHGSGMECASSWMKRYSLPLLAFNFFPSGNIEQQECLVKIWIFSGFVWTFLYINWVFYAFMCIIQIWTTGTCSSA